MAFILADRATITTRVEIGIPLDLGKTEKAYLDVTWKRQSVSEKKAHTEKLRAGDIKDDELITQLITNIEGAKDENGTELTFSPELLAQLLEIDYVRQPFTEELPENWQALEIFLACQTQWRIVAGMGGVFYQGLDYPALMAVIKLHSKPKHRKALFKAVQMIEQGALECINHHKG